MISVAIIATILLSLVLLIFVEVLKRTADVPVYVTRKLAHFGGAAIAFLSPYFLEGYEIIIICLALIIALTLSRKTALLSSVQSVDRVSFGELFLPLGVIISALLFLPQNLLAFQFGVLVMGISDGLAGIAGERFARKYFYVFSHKKSILGTCVFFFTCLLISLVYLPNQVIAAICMASLLTVVELVLGYGMDNLFLPVLGGFLLLIFT